MSRISISQYLISKFCKRFCDISPDTIWTLYTSKWAQLSAIWTKITHLLIWLVKTKNETKPKSRFRNFRFLQKILTEISIELTVVLIVSYKMFKSCLNNWCRNTKFLPWSILDQLVLTCLRNCNVDDYYILSSYIHLIGPPHLSVSFRLYTLLYLST